MAALESDYVRLLAARAVNLETEIARLRSVAPPTASAEATEPPSELITPAYIGRALVAIEDHLADMDRFAAIGDDPAARRSKVATVSRACSTLKRLCDDDDFHSMLTTMAAHVSQQQTKIPGEIGTPSNAAFREAEIQLLQLAALTRMLAEAHVDAAVAEYHSDTSGWHYRITNPLTFLGDVRQLRDASCLTADLLSQGIRHERSRQRWRKLLTCGLGGTLIVVVNTVGAALLTPAGVAASGAIGSAAIGAAVQLVS